MKQAHPSYIHIKPGPGSIGWKINRESVVLLGGTRAVLMQLAHQLLFPPVHTIVRPLLHLNLQITSALLPQPIREIYGIEWNARRQVVFDCLLEE